MVTVRKIIIIACSVVLSAACALVLFLPLPQTVGSKEYYSCHWQNGSVTTESYYTAYSALTGATEREILLSRDGLAGEITASEEFARAVELFESGELLALLELRLNDINRIEKAALYAMYGGCGYWAGEFFAWDGERFFRTSRKIFDEVYLMTGSISASELIKTGAKKLIVGGDAALKAKALVGTAIEAVEARAPYYEADGAIYLKTVSGIRLIAALPTVKSLKIDCDYIDDGALSPCTELEELTLPDGYDGTLKTLFGDTPVPEKLKRS